MASVVTTRRSIPGKIFSKTAEYLGNGALEYLGASMPTGKSIVIEARKTVADVSKAFKNTTQSVLPNVKTLRNQLGLKNIVRWYTDELNDYQDGEFDGADLNFDIPTDMTPSEQTKAQISETAKSANQIASTVVGTSKQLVESNIQLTANILTSIDNQTSVIGSGFQSINETLGKMLEIITANQEASIKASAATAAMFATKQEENAKDKYFGSDKFSLDAYLKVVNKNLENHPILGTLKSYAPMLNGQTIQQFLQPQNLISGAMSILVNKMLPGIQDSLKNLDKTLSVSIQDALLRLGDKAGQKGILGELAKIFGTSSARNEFGGPRLSSLELKAVPFDTMTKEAIINVIPGYLQRIEKALSGNDVKYDYRSRSFKTNAEMVREFQNAGAIQGSMGRASNSMRKAFGTDEFSQMFYDMMMTDLSSKSGSDISKTLENWQKSPSAFRNYASNLMKRSTNSNLNSQERRWIKQTGRFVNDAMNSTGGMASLRAQIARESANRNSAMEKYIAEAALYNVDIGDVQTSVNDELQRILDRNNYKTKKRMPAVKSKNMVGLSGVDYTNAALYEIFKTLQRGINVYQVGADESLSKAYTDDHTKLLPPPVGHKPKDASVLSNGARSNPIMREAFKRSSENDPNLLRGEYVMEDDPDRPGEKRIKRDENGNPIKSTTTGARVGSWAKSNGSSALRALMSGDVAGFLGSLGHAARDVREIAQDSGLNWLQKYNASHGNISGYLRHKLTGQGYSYDDNGQTVEVATNEKGGALGFIKNYVKDEFLDPIKQKSANWFKSVASYFDYGDDKDNKDGSAKSKRKKFLTASVGAMAGAGILGGPIGLIMGGLAGSALSGFDVGGKIKNILFGNKEKGTRGLLGKATDAIIDPIRFQVGKTIHRAAGVIKKNVLGPISDIGFAIKERVANAAKKAASETFGKVFKFIGKAIAAPFKIAGNVLKFLGLDVGGGLARRGIDVAGGVTGFGLNRIADIIGGKGVHEALKDRRDMRRSEFRREQEYSEYADYATWKRNKDARNQNRIAELEDATKETTEAVDKTNQIIEERTMDLPKLIHEGVYGHSIHVQDETTHAKLDSILIQLGGNPSSQVIHLGNSDNGDLAGAALTATMIAQSNGGFSESEKQAENQLISRITSGQKISNQEIGSLTKRILAKQGEQKVEGEEKEKSLLERIVDTVGGIANGLFGGGLGSLLKIGAILAGLWALFNGNDPANVSNSIISNVSSAANNIFNPNMSDPSGSGINAALNLVGVNANSKWDLLNPTSSLYHIHTTAGGQQIYNSSATTAKNYLITNPLRSAYSQQISSMRFSNHDFAELSAMSKNIQATNIAKQMNALGELHSEAIAAGDMQSARMYHQQYKQLDRQMAELEKGATASRAKSGTYGSDYQAAEGTYGSSMARNLVKGAANIGIASGAGSLSGWMAQGIATSFGADESTASKIGASVNAGTSGLLVAQNATKNAFGKKGILDKIREFLTGFAQKGKAGKFFGSALKALDNIINTVMSKISKIITEPIAAVIERRFGAETAKSAAKQVGGAATAGVLIAAGALTGFVNGTIGTEYLFRVLPNNADQTMYNISMGIKSIYGALEWVPYVGIAMAVVYCVDAVLNSLGARGLTQMLADAIYSASMGEDALIAKQAKLDAATSQYNQKFGTKITTQEFNDLINNSDAFSEWMNGKRDGFDVLSNFDESGNLKIKEGTLGYAFTDLLSGGQYSRDRAMEAERKTYSDIQRAVNAKEATWQVQKDWATAAEIRASMPANLRKILDETYGGDLAKFANHSDEAMMYVENMLYARMNEGKAIQSGVWKYGENGKLIKGESQELDLSTGKTKAGNVPSNLTIDDLDLDLRAIDKSLGTSAAGWMWTEEDYNNWKVQKNFPEAYQLRQMLPESVRDLSLDELYQGGYKIKIKGQEYNAAKLMAFASMNTKKAIEEGIWKENPDGSITKQEGYQVIDMDTSSGLKSWNPIVNSSDVISDYDQLSNQLVDGETENGFYNDVLGDMGTLGSMLQSIGLSSEATASKLDEICNLIRNNHGVGGGIGGEAINNGAPSNVYRDENDNGYAKSGNTQGGNPLSKAAHLSLGYSQTATDSQGHVIYTSSNPHKGIDIVPDDGSGEADVVSKWEGKVTYVKNTVPGVDKSNKDNAFGNNVSILTRDENGNEFTVRHGHLKLNSIPSNIKEGAIVHVGDKIGEMGTTGYSTGPHLHYQFNAGDNPRYEYGGLIDPTQSYLSGSNVGVVSNAGTSSGVTSSNSQVIEQSENTEGSLGTIISKVKEVGSELLYKLTGGILGSKLDNADNTKSYVTLGGSSSSSVSTLDAFMQIVLSEVGVSDDSDGLNKYNKWFYDGLTAEKVKYLNQGITVKQVMDSLTDAEKQAYSYAGSVALPKDKREMMNRAMEAEKRAGTISKVYEGSECVLDAHNYRTWDMPFVYWCFNRARTPIPKKTDNYNIFIKYVKQNAEKKGWRIFDTVSMLRNHLYAERGDIFAMYKPTGGRSYLFGIVDTPVKGKEGWYNVVVGSYKDQDNSPAKVKRLPMNIAQSRGYIIRLLNLATVQDKIQSQIIDHGDIETTYAMLKALGYTDEQAAGIIGNFMREHGVRSRVLEYDYAKNFDPALYDKVETDRDAIDNWTERFVSELQHQYPGRYDLESWRGSDGHLYPGIGIGSFTGPNGEAFLKWIKEKGRSWDDGAAQLSYIDENIRTKSVYSDLRRKFNENRDAAGMARAFQANYEFLTGNEDTKYANEGAKNATQIWNNYPELRSKYPNVPELAIQSDEMLASQKAAGADTSDGYFGGPNAGMSRISIPKYSQRRTQHGPLPSATSRSYRPTRLTSPNAIGGDAEASYANLSEVIRFLSIIAGYLGNIDNNTGDTSGWLAAISEKNFKDEELREVIAAAGKAKIMKKHPQSTSGKSTAKGITKLARP